MCNPLCATAQRMAELEKENARLREALRPFAEFVTILPGGEIVGLERHWFDNAKAVIASPTPQEARDAG